MHVVTFRGEHQLRVSRGGQMSVIKKDDLFIRGSLIKTEKLPETLITIAEENLIVFMTMRGEERDNA